MVGRTGAEKGFPLNDAVFLLCMLNLLSIGLLPKIFFRKDGRFNAMWWVTALPFLLCALFLIMVRCGVLSPFALRGCRGVADLVAVCLSAVSIALIGLTLGTHRIPLALWHQDDDAPRQLVTYGVYRWIRHPFYAAFLLALLGALACAPHWVTLYTFAHGCVVLTITAVREEQRLRASAFGAEYESYVQRTGRFWPRLSAGHTAHRMRQRD